MSRSNWVVVLMALASLTSCEPHQLSTVPASSATLPITATTPMSVATAPLASSPGAGQTFVSVEWPGAPGLSSWTLQPSQMTVGQARFHNLTSLPVKWWFNLIVTPARPPRLLPSQAVALDHLDAAIWDYDRTASSTTVLVLQPRSDAVVQLTWTHGDMSGTRVQPGPYHFVFVAHCQPDRVPTYVSTTSVNVL